MSASEEGEKDKTRRRPRRVERQTKTLVLTSYPAAKTEHERNFCLRDKSCCDTSRERSERVGVRGSEKERRRDEERESVEETRREGKMVREKRVIGLAREVWRLSSSLFQDNSRRTF